MSNNLYNKNEFAYLYEPRDLVITDEGKITRPRIVGASFLLTVYSDDNDVPASRTPIPGLTDLPFNEAGGSGNSGVYLCIGPGEYVPLPSSKVWIEIRETGLYANRCYWYFHRNVVVRKV